MTRSKWKVPFVDINIINKIKLNPLSKTLYTNSRNSIILKSFVGWTFFVHKGNEYSKILINNNMVGLKLGEFSFSRKIGNIHIKKINKKGKKK